jgi:hypothetical protein
MPTKQPVAPCFLVVSRNTIWLARVRRTQSAAVLLALLTRCCSATAKDYLFCSFRKEGCCSMRIHLDSKRLDGNAIAFVLITLFIVIVMAY